MIPCAETGDTCSETTWHKQRRTAKLRNGSVLWDIWGNAAKWVAGGYAGPIMPDEWIALLPGSDIRASTLGNDQNWH